jgi:hypothetical protein
MNTINIQEYFDRHCKFKLRGGKEVYGVIWEVNNGLYSEHFFASVYDHQTYQKAKRSGDIDENLYSKVNIEEIIHAESLVS